MFERFSHSKKIKELQETVEKLQRDFQNLELTWIDTSHKLKSILGRVTKSEALAKERDEKGPTANIPDFGNWTPNGGMLTEKQKMIQQQILRRRGGG